MYKSPNLDLEQWSNQWLPHYRGTVPKKGRDDSKNKTEIKRSCVLGPKAERGDLSFLTYSVSNRKQEGRNQEKSDTAPRRKILFLPYIFHKKGKTGRKTEKRNPSVHPETCMNTGRGENFFSFPIYLTQKRETGRKNWKKRNLSVQTDTWRYTGRGEKILFLPYISHKKETGKETMSTKCLFPGNSDAVQI